jgi:hypothetical protein
MDYPAVLILQARLLPLKRLWIRTPPRTEEFGRNFRMALSRS